MDKFIKENISLKRMRHPGIEVVLYCYKLHEWVKVNTVTCKLY